MKLIQDQWLLFLELEHAFVKGLHLTDYKKSSEAADFYTVDFFMRGAKTIVLPSDLMMELMASVDKVDCHGPLHLPYPATLIQFTHPIPEKDMMVHLEDTLDMGEIVVVNDHISGLLLCNPYQGHVLSMDMLKVYDRVAMNSIALFTSTAVSRVAWEDPGEGRKAIPLWDKMAKPQMDKRRRENKVRLLRISYLLDLFLNAPNVTVELKRPDEKVNRKRVAKGKARLPEYHVVSIKKLQGVYVGEVEKGGGKQHSHMYPVRGHFRQYKNMSKPVWIPNHYRGLKHGFESLRPGVYQVKPEYVDTHVQPREE